MYWVKRVRRHVVLALVSAALAAAIFCVLSSPDGIFKLSMASAYAGLVLLGASLIVGPWNVLRSRPNPVSTDLRRDIGIWAGLVGIFHVVIGLQVHMRGKLWLYFVYPSGEHHLLPLRYDPFGFANYTGLGATLALLLLLALSNDLSLRRLGTIRWKSLQRWNYACGALVVLHGIAFQLIEERVLPFIALFGAIVLVAAAFQFAGFRTKRSQPDRVRQNETLAES